MVSLLLIGTFLLSLISISNAKPLSHLDVLTPLTKFAFGSCNKHELDQSIWASVLSYSPQLWVWVGDASYNDEKIFPGVDQEATLESITTKYAKVKNNTLYSRVNEKIPLTGIWDDHDYGVNDGDSQFPLRRGSQQEFLKFLEEPQESIRWSREGIYFAISVGPKNRQVKLIFLDHRSFRDPKETALQGGDILGETQWKWLEKQLKNSQADLNFIFTGTQLLPNDKPLREKWANYPTSYQRFFEVLENSLPKGVIIFSGDIHYSEVLKTSCTGSLGYPLYEFTSSGLTHSCLDDLGQLCPLFLDTIWKSKMLEGSAYPFRNFGTVEILWDKTPVQILLQTRDVNGTLLQQIAVEAGIPTGGGSCHFEQAAWWVIIPKKDLARLALQGGIFCGALFLVGAIIHWKRKKISKEKKTQ